jgi:uncharacterized UBP type Zn finger protein
MTNKEIQYFTVENGINTCYIDAVLMGLFYTPSSIYYTMLNCDPVKDIFLYFQETIKYNFIEIIRKNKSITADTINGMRNYLFYYADWLNNNENELLEQQDINEFYTYLINNLSNQHIEIIRTTITEGIETKNDTGIKEKIPFITLNIPDTVDEICVKKLINKWLTNNPVTVKRETIEEGKKVYKTVNALNIYRVTNIPQIVPLYINRFNTAESKKSMTKIEIKEKIRLFDENDDLGKIKWNIHSIICHTGETIKKGHYYTLLINANKWLLFDDMSIPCLCEVDMSDKMLIDKIKSEATFIIYKYES